jgi:hypothetical protein
MIVMAACKACSVAPISILRGESAILIHFAGLSYKLSVVLATDAVEDVTLFNVSEGRGLVSVLDIAHSDGDDVRNFPFAGLNRDGKVRCGCRDGNNRSAEAILIRRLRVSLLRP